MQIPKENIKRQGLVPFRCMSDIHNDYLIRTAWAGDLRNTSSLQNSQQTLASALLAFREISSMSSSGDTQVRGRIAFILDGGYKRLAAELAYLTLGTDSIEFLKAIYLENPDLLRVFLYISRLRTYQKVSALALSHDSSPGQSPSLTSWKTGSRIAKHLSELEPSRIHLTPFHSVSCGHANSYLHAFAYRVHSRNRDTQLFIWSSSSFSINSVIESVLSTDDDITLLQYEAHFDDIELLAEAYDCDSWFNTMNYDNIINLHAWQNEFVWEHVRIDFSLLLNRYLACLPQDTEKDLTADVSSEDFSQIVPVHVRTPYFKGSSSEYDRLRDADPNTYFHLVKRLSDDGYTALFYAAGEWPYRNLDSFVARGPGDVAKQLYHITRADFMVACTSGISHLAILASSYVLHINATCFLHNDYIPADNIFCMKKIVLRSCANGRLSGHRFAELLLLNWTCDAFTSYFHLESLTALEIEESYTAFKAYRANSGEWEFSLKKLLLDIYAPVANRFPDRTLAPSTYFNIAEIARTIKP